MKKYLFIFSLFLLSSCDPATINSTLGTIMDNSSALSSADIGNGLKQALEIGISNGSQRLSQKDGFLKSNYKILLPPEVRKVTEKLESLPLFSKVEQELVTLLNRAAEDAVKSAKPIFVNAIKNMSFRDATKILMGEKNAATDYLKRTTSKELYSAFLPKVKTSMDRVNATNYWNKISSSYNKIPFVEKVNPNINDYVTNQAIKSLFSMVEKEERSIRTNTAKRSTDLLKKVFAKQD